MPTAKVDPVGHLAVAESQGRRLPKVLKQPDESIVVWDPPSRPCPGCQEVTNAGEAITKIYEVWWHYDCAKKYLEGAGKDEAWRVLGSQLAAHPSMFRATTTRAIVQNLLRMVGGSS